MKTQIKAVIRVRPIGDHFRLSVDTGKNVYTVTTDDGALDTSIDILMDTICDKELGFTKHKLIRAVVDERRKSGGI